MCAFQLKDTVPFPRKVITIGKKAALVQAIELMRSHKIHHLVVIEDSVPCGVLSDRDIIANGLANHSVVLNPILNVGEAMHPISRYFTDTTDLREAIDIMHKEGCSAIPLMSKGELTGIVTESDLLQILRTLLSGSMSHKDSEKDKAETTELGPRDKGQVMLGNPLVQNVMKMISEMGI
jgi:CBS domain-containing protein